MKKTNKFLSYILVIIITIIITSVITGVTVYCVAKAPQTIASDNFFANMINTIANSVNGNTQSIEVGQKIDDINKKLKEIYIGEIDEKKMEEAALEAYVAALGDEYTEYLTERELTALIENANGAYVGVGVYIASIEEKNEILVMGVLEDSPAHKAGIKPGDIIKKIDDKEYKGSQLTEASNVMRGTEGTTVKITVERNGELIDIDVVRANIKLKCVSSKKLEDRMGYIKISSFDGGCAKDFKEQYEKLKNDGIDSLVIDLRNNGGGLLDESLAIAEMIVPKNSTMIITRDAKNNEEASTSKTEPTINVPVVILVNGYTASASEVLTAAVKENTNTKVVGTKTFGKGIIQGVFLFSDKKTGMKITMQEYYTPNHTKIHKVGITPDYVIQLDDGTDGKLSLNGNKIDNQLAKAMELLKK